MKIVIQQNKKINYDNLFDIVINNYPSLKNEKFSNIWNNLQLDEIVLEYNLEFFNNSKIVEYNFETYINTLNEQFEILKVYFNDKLKRQLFEIYFEKIFISFLTFKDYYNIITLVLKSSSEILNYLNIDIEITNYSINELKYYLKHLKDLDIYRLLTNNMHTITFNKEQEKILTIFSNIFLFNYFHFIKYLIYLEFNDIITFVKSNKLLSNIEINNINLLDLINIEKKENDELLNMFYKELNYILSSIKINNNLDNINKDNIKNFIELKIGNIIYLYQLLNVINEIFELQYYNINIISHLFDKSITISKHMKLFSKFIVTDDYFNSNISTDEIQTLHEQLVNNIIDKFYTFFYNSIKNIDIISLIKNETLMNFVNFIIPNFWINSIDYLYNFYHSYFSKLFVNYKHSIKFNYFVDFNIQLDYTEENYFNLLKYNSTYYDMYLKYYFMSYYIIQDKIFVDLLNVIDDEYFYNMSKNETMKTYLINLMAHLSTQTYLKSLQLKNLYNIDITQMKYIKQIQNNYFGDLNFDISQSLSEQTNKFIFMFLTKFSYIKGTKRIIYKIIKILSQLTNDLIITNTNDYIQTTKKFNIFDSKTYSIRLKENNNDEFYLSKTFNYDINTFTKELYKIIESKNIKIRKYIYSNNKMTQRNILILQSKLFKGIDINKLMTSNLSILQNYNDILEMILIFTKQLILFSPIYYEIYLEQLISDYNVTKLNFLYLIELLYSYYSNKESDNYYKYIYNYQIIYPYFVSREKYYVRYLKRYDDNTDSIYNVLSPIFVQEINLFRTLNNYSYQYQLKKYVEYYNLFENYHYNINIQNNKYMFLPTNLLPLSNNEDLNEYITQINYYFTFPTFSINKYIRYIKYNTYYKQQSNFEDSFYMNDLRYKQLKLSVFNFDIMSDSYIYHTIQYKNLFNKNDQYIFNWIFNIKDINPQYTSKHYLIMKPIITNSYNILYRRVQYQQNTITEKFFFNTGILLNKCQELITKISLYTREQLLSELIYLLDNFLNNYSIKYYRDKNLEFYQWLTNFILTSSDDEIKDYILNVIQSTLNQFSQTVKYKTTDYNSPDSELLNVEYNEFNQLQPQIDKMLLRVNEIISFNQRFFQNIWDLYYFENYNLYSESYYIPLILDYQDQRLLTNYETYKFLYPKYRPVSLNKITINETYDFINDSSYNFDINKLLQIVSLNNKHKNSKMILYSPVYRDIIETYELIGFDLFVSQDTYYGFGEVESKPLFEVSRQFIEIFESTINSDKFVTSTNIPQKLQNII